MSAEGTTGDDGAWRARIEALVLDGENLKGLASGPKQGARDAFRTRYLAWHDDVMRTLDGAGHDQDARVFETTRWQLVVGGRVTDDELVRTILSDIDVALQQLRRIIDVPTAVPERAIPDPATVGVAVYDANCLFSKHARYLLLAFAVYGVVIARWSRRLLEETAANLAGTLRGDSLEDFGRWIKTETDLVRDGLVEHYDRWLGEVTLPDPGDAHVLAAAIEAGANVIVTDNIRHFPAAELARYGITAARADDFVLGCIDANPVIAARIVTEHPDPDSFLDRITAALPVSAARLRELTS